MENQEKIYIEIIDTIISRPIERYLLLLLNDNLSDKYHTRILTETSGEIKKKLLDRLPPAHILIESIRKLLKIDRENVLPIQL